MTCSEYEPLLALYVEGDLDDRGVERHLAECAGCRAALEDLRASQAMLKELGAEPVDAEWLSAVRAGVLAKVRRRKAWPWIAGCAAAAALVVALIPAPARRTTPATPPPPKVAVARVPAAPEPAPAVALRKRLRPRKRKTEPLVVKMLTEDPNIVIIWLVDQPGD